MPPRSAAAAEVEAEAVEAGAELVGVAAATMAAAHRWPARRQPLVRSRPRLARPRRHGPLRRARSTVLMAGRRLADGNPVRSLAPPGAAATLLDRVGLIPVRRAVRPAAVRAAARTQRAAGPMS